MPAATVLAVGLEPSHLATLSEALSADADLRLEPARDPSDAASRLDGLAPALGALVLEPRALADLTLLQRARDVAPHVETLVVVRDDELARWRDALRTSPRIGPYVACLPWRDATSAAAVSQAVGHTRQRLRHQRALAIANARLPAVPTVVADPELSVALRRSEERFRLLVDGVRDHAMIMVGVDGRIESWNPGAQRIHGFTAAEVLGRAAGRLFWSEDPEDDPLEPQLALSRVAGRAEFQAQGLRRDGSRFVAHVVVSALTEAHTDRGFALVERDVTDRVEADLEREALVEELAEALRARDLFLSIASHELNTPLTGLILKLQGLLRRWRRAPGSMSAQAVIDRVASMETHAFRLSHLVRELLDVTRIATGGLELSSDDVDLVQLVRDVASRFEAQAESAQVTMMLPDGPPVWIRCDALRLEQVVTNLISNALRHAPGSPVALTVDVDGAVARLTVRDEGPGIPAGTEERIFERFERLESSADKGGLGLGLWLSRKLVEACGGRIRARADVPSGACFVVELPRSPSA